MNTALSLACTTVTEGGRSAWICGIAARTPAETSSGLAVALRMTPVDTTALPFSRASVRSLAAPSSMRATSASRTG